MSESETQDQWDIRQLDYWRIFSITLLLWDHFLTLDKEVKFLWKRPRNVSGYLFFINRYFSPIANLVGLVSLFDTTLSVQRCQNILVFRQGAIILAQLVVVLILTLRIYALYGCSKRLLYVLGGIIAVLLAMVAVFTFIDGQEKDSPSLHCHTSFGSSQLALRKSIAWVVLGIYDAIIFGLAVYNAFRTRRELRFFPNRRSLKLTLLRDGAVYFGIMALANFTNIATFFFAGPYMRGGAAVAASSLSVTLTSRLMLHLHEAVDVGIYASKYTVRAGESVEPQIVFREHRFVAPDGDRQHLDSKV